MALETLIDIREIDGFKISRGKPADMTWEQFDEHRKDVPIHISDVGNMISFKIQNGPIKEVGVNGCQVDTLIEAAKLIITGLNAKFPCPENAYAITHLHKTLQFLEARKKDREARGVEGRDQP